MKRIYNIIIHLRLLDNHNMLMNMGENFQKCVKLIGK